MKIAALISVIALPLSVFAEIIDIDRVTQAEAFDSMLGLIHEVDVSGVPAEALEQMESIKGFKAEAADGEEVFLFQLFSDKGQIGGTFMAGAQATHCAPALGILLLSHEKRVL